MRRLIPVQFFSWLALFSMWLYTTAAVTQVHFHSQRHGIGRRVQRGRELGRRCCSAAYNGFAAIAAVAIPFMVRRLGPARSHLVNVLARRRRPVVDRAHP